MPQRRMISPKVIDTDAFMEMPATTQNLYFHMLLRADDDGFIANPKRLLRMLGASDDDMKVLVTKQYVIPFDSGVCVIRHWRVHNMIRADRYHETDCIEEKSQLTVNNKMVYENVVPNGNQLSYQRVPEVRLGKGSIGKESKENVSQTQDGEPEKPPKKQKADTYHPTLGVPMNQTRYDTLIASYGQKLADDLIQRVIDYSMRKKGDTSNYKEYASAAAEFARRDGIPKQSKPKAPPIRTRDFGKGAT